ncbi:Uncharacterised protein [Yersinia aldovae]|nr:Uncharacterised protein [Yersinia aldovae]
MIAKIEKQFVIYILHNSQCTLLPFISLNDYFLLIIL